MFIVETTGVYLMKGVASIEQYKKLEKKMLKYYNEEALKFFMLYVCYMYNTDKKQNFYIRLPLSDRESLILDDHSQQLLDGFGTEEKFRSFMEKDEDALAFVSFYKKHCFSDEDKIIERLRNKIDYWLNEIETSTDPKGDKDIYTAITEATKMIETYTVKKEQLEDEGAVSGALYLFEIPEEYKPHYMKLKGYTP